MLPWMHPIQFTAATTTPLLPAAGGATTPRQPLVWPRKLRAHQTPVCDAPSAPAHAPRHLPFSCHPCSRELLSVLQALPKALSNAMRSAFHLSTCQLLAVCIQGSSLQLAQYTCMPNAGGATRQRRPWVWQRKLRVHYVPPLVMPLQLQLVSRHLSFWCLQQRGLESATSPTKARQLSMKMFPPECESTAGCVHPTQLIAASTTPTLARCWRRNMTRHPLFCSRTLYAHLMPPHVERLWPRTRHAICLSRVTPAAESF